MDKPRIFLGSSAQQEKLLQGLTRGLSDIARVEPWMTSFTPGTSALERLLELTQEVDFAAFVFAQDDWTTSSPSASSQPGPGQASPRDNVVFEAGLFGGTLGMRRTFILHANGAKLPSDLLGLTCVRYDGALTPSEIVAAWLSGAAAVKVFPASVGGPRYLRDVRVADESGTPLFPDSEYESAYADLEQARPSMVTRGAVAFGL